MNGMANVSSAKARTEETSAIKVQAKVEVRRTANVQARETNKNNSTDKENLTFKESLKIKEYCIKVKYDVYKVNLFPEGTQTGKTQKTKNLKQTSKVTAKKAKSKSKSIVTLARKAF